MTKFYATEIQALPDRSKDIIEAGYAYSDFRCTRFFNSVQANRNANSFTGAELAAATTATGAVTAFTRSSTIVAGLVTAVMGFGSSSVTNYGHSVLLEKYNQQLHGLVGRAQEAFKKNITDNYDSSTLSKAQAYDIVVGYAYLCSLPSIDELAGQAISIAQPMATNAPAAGAPAPAPPPAPAGSPPPATAPGVALPSIRVQ